MTSVRTVRFYDLCRICATNSDGKVDIFSSEGKMKNLWYKISECLSLTVEEKDRLPKVLCLQCVQNVETFMEFRNICNNSQIKLNNWLNAAIGESAAVKWVNQNANNSTINKTNTTSNTLCQDLKQDQGQGKEQSMAVQSSDCVNTNVHDSVVQPVTTIENHVQSNNEFLNSLIQNAGPPVVKNENIQNSNNGHDVLQGQQYTSQMQTLVNNHDINGSKATDFKNNTLEEFLKMKPNLKVTPVRQKQQQNQKLRVQQEHEQFQQQQQDQMQLQQLQQQLQQQIQQQQLQQQLQLQLLTSQFQPQQITITAPNTTLMASINGQNLPTSTPSVIQNGTNISLDNARIMNTSAANAAGTMTVNGIETVDETGLLKNKRPKLNLILTPPRTAAQDITTNLAQLSTGANVTMQPQIQLQLQPTLPSAQITSAQQQQQQQQQCNVSTSTLFSNLAPYLQAPTQNQLVNTVLQSSALASTQANSTNVFASPSKCYLPITIKDDVTDQQYIAHIDAKNFILPTTYQIQMKLQPQLATADGQPIMQLAPTSIPATLQLTPQSLPTTQTFQTITNMSPFNQNSNNNNGTSNNNVLNGFQTTLSQIPQLQQQQQQQQQQRQLDVQIQTSASSNEQILQNKVPDAITQSEIINDFHKKQQQQQISLPKNVQITSQQIISTGKNGKIFKDLTTTNSAVERNQLPPSSVTAKVNKSSILTQNNYAIAQNNDSAVEIIPSNSTKSSDATSIVTASNLKQQLIKQFCQKQKQQTQHLQQQTQAQQAQLQQFNTSSMVIQQHGGITVQRITTGKANTHAVVQQTDSQKLQRSPLANHVKLSREQQHQQLQENQSELPQLPHQAQQINSNAIKLPMLNKQNVTIRCVTKKSNKSLQEQQQQQHALTTETTAPPTTMATIRTTTKETTSASAVTISNFSQGISNQRHHNQQQKQQQIKTKRLLTLPTQRTAANTQTTSTSVTITTSSTNPCQSNTSKSKQPQQLLHGVHSSVQISTTGSENVLYNNNHNKNNERQDGVKSAVKNASTPKKILLKKSIKGNVNAITDTSINSSGNNDNIHNNNKRNININNNVEGNIEKSIQLPVGTTTTIPPGKYIIKDLNTAKALIAAATAASSTTVSNNHNKQQARQSEPTNITITKAIAKTKPLATTTVNPITASANALPTSLANNATITQILVNSRTSNSNSTIGNTTTVTTATTEATRTPTTTMTPTKYPLECATCFKLFKKREHLTQHVKLHAGVRPFKCSENDCNKAFSRKEHLHRHLISHTGKKLFSCDICQKPFSRKDNLSKHRRTHTDSGNSVKYICEICNKSFAVKAYYQQHKKQHQSKEVDRRDENDEKKTLQKNLKVTAETITPHSSEGTVNSEAELNQTTEQQLLQQLKEIHTQIELAPQETQQQHQQHTVTMQPTTQIMHLQFPTSLISSQDLSGCNTITITQANSHNDNITNSNNNKCNNNNVTLKALTNNSIHNNHDAAVLTLPTSLADFVQQAQFINTTTGQIVGHLKIGK